MSLEKALRRCIRSIRACAGWQASYGSGGDIPFGIRCGHGGGQPVRQQLVGLPTFVA